MLIVGDGMSSTKHDVVDNGTEGGLLYPCFRAIAARQFGYWREGGALVGSAEVW